MKLDRLTKRIWVYPYEKERDRPNLVYIQGDRWSLAVDAGHSESHIREFYATLAEADLPLPTLTVLTHWHWDHTFAMHAAHGLCLANEKTNRYLADFRAKIKNQGRDYFLAMDECIRREYEDGKPIIITLADMVFHGEMTLDAGNCLIRVFQAESPHTDDTTLVEVPDEGVLILGDSTGGTFPDWKKDLVLAGRLAETIRKVNPEICLPGHEPPLSRENAIHDLLEY